MIEGHGDDLHHYHGVPIRYNFSSNVPTIIDHTALYRYLSEQLPLITSYPEPSPRSLEISLAEQLGITAEEVMVTNGGDLPCSPQFGRETFCHLLALF